MKRKLILLVLAFCIVLGGNVYSASDKYQEALFDITSLGIFIPDEDGEYRTDDNLTRAEFAQVIIRVMGYDIEFEYSGTFPDVSSDDWFCKPVETVAALNLMVGDENGLFRPEEYVTYEEAAKTIVNMLGYSSEAINLGGYPSGYVLEGMKLGVMQGLDMGEDFLRGDLAVMIYNALDVKLLVSKYTQDPTYYVGENTYRDQLMTYAKERIYKLKGIVKANAYSYTEFPIEEIQDDEVVIDHTLYNIGDTQAEKYLGMEIEFFCRKNTDDTLTLISVRPTDKNNITEIQAEDFEEYTADGKLYYSTESGKRRSVSIAGACILKNGMPVDVNSDNGIGNVFDIKFGSITVINNGSGGSADVVFVESYENVLVRSVSNSVSNIVVNFYDGFTLAGDKRLNIDLNDTNVKYEILAPGGSALEPSAIKEDCLLSVYADENKCRYRIYVSDKKVNGVLSSVMKDAVKIDDETYAYSGEIIIDAKVGDSVDAYIDYEDKAAVIHKAVSETTYGYIIDADDNAFGGGRVKVLIGKTVSFSADVNDEDADNVTSVPVLICENDSIKVFDTDDRLYIDGTKVRSDNIAKYLKTLGAVKLRTNSDGVLKYIETMEIYGGNIKNKLKYNVYDKTFGGNAFIKGFALDENTKIICIPETVNTDDDYLVRTRIDINGNTEGYLVQGYDRDEKTKKVGLVVLTKGMDASLVQSASETSSDMCMVLEVNSIWNEETETIGHSIVMLENGKEATYNTVELKEENNLIENLRKGDLITYLLNDSNLIENVMIIHSFGNPEGSYSIQHHTRNYVENCGTVSDISRFEVDDVQNKLSALIKLNIQGSDTTIYVPERNTPPVYIYDYTTRETVRAASLDEMVPGDDKLYIVSISGTTPKACVIIRGESL